LRLAGTATVAQPGERVLFVYGPEIAHQVAREVASARIDIVEGYTELQLKPRFSIGDAGKSRELSEGLVTLREEVVTARPPISDGLVAAIASFFLGGSADDSAKMANRLAN